MKILLLFSYGISLQHWNNIGIIDREISLYKKLLEKGLEFKFLTYGNENDLNFKHLLQNIEIIPILNRIESRNSILILLKSIFLPLNIKSIFKDVDIIKTNQVNGCWIGLIIKILYHRKLIIRGGYEWFRNYTSKSKVQKLGIKHYLRQIINYIYIFITEFIAYKLADLIILTSKSDIDFIVNTFKLKHKRKKIHYLPNFIDVNLFKQLDITKKVKHVLFIGQLKMEKNLFNLLNAIKSLKGFTLDIIGSGPEEIALKSLAKQHDIDVNFLGVIPNNRLPEIINQYQIFILPSYYEGNPKALLEAMSCGLACIGTNVRGIRDIIKHKENGFLCGLSADSISRAIAFLYKNKNLREKLGNSARKYILANCSLEMIAKKEFLTYIQLMRK